MSQPSGSSPATTTPDLAVPVVTSAFARDPVERWLYPDDEAYLEAFPDFVAALGGRGFDEETAGSVDDGSAVSIWLPPGVAPDEEAVIDVLAGSVDERQHLAMFAVLEQMAEAHPTEPHWYLAWLAVRPREQGRGLGGALLASTLTTVDASGLPAYLETPNPRTVPLYEGHGFRVVGSAQAGTCPPVTLMARDPRG